MSSKYFIKINFNGTNHAVKIGLKRTLTDFFTKNKC